LTARLAGLPTAIARAALPIAVLALLPAVPARAERAAPAGAPASFAFAAPVRIAEVEIDAVDGVFVSDPDRDFVLKQIRSRLDARLPRTEADAPVYRMLVLLTRFSRGTAAARMSLIGLGGIHVEGKVRLTAADGTVLPDVVITKGLVIGGLAGGFASSDSVVGRFANAVVASVQPDAESAARAADR
jgi:hypothetical protein